MRRNYKRSLPRNEYINDRWKRSEKLGFGFNTSIYDNSFVYGDVKIGKETWIGPFTILDGSGILNIGDYCTISAGVHIYTHDNINQTLTSKKSKIERESVIIGNNVYIGPYSVLAKGIKIENNCIVATGSFVNKSFKKNTIIAGTPAKEIGKIEIIDDKIKYNYNI